MDTTHLVALHEGLTREKQKLSETKTAQERELRTVWIAQREREIAGEMKFLGMTPDADLPEMSPDDLLAELMEG